MAAPYLEELEKLLLRLEPNLPPDTEITCKHFFSGAAAYANGKIFMSLSPAGLALKLPDETRADLIAQGGTPLRYFPKAPIKRDYVVLPDSITRDPTRIVALTLESLAFVAPAKR